MLYYFYNTIYIMERHLTLKYIMSCLKSCFLFSLDNLTHRRYTMPFPIPKIKKGKITMENNQIYSVIFMKLALWLNSNITPNHCNISSYDDDTAALHILQK